MSTNPDPPHPLVSRRSALLDLSGIRRVFELGAKLTDPINLSIGQPEFAAPREVTEAAAAAIGSGHNGYTLSQGTPALRSAIAKHLRWDVGWDVPLSGGGDGPGLMVTSGTSGALLLAFMALLDPGDEAVIPDPYFVIYPSAIRLAGGVPVRCQTRPDMMMTAERVEPLLTERTKLVVLNTPSNPTGAVLGSRACGELLELCRSRGVVLLSDEIYDEFVFSECRTEPAAGVGAGAEPHAGSAGAPSRCPSPARRPGAEEHVLLVRGFGKTYGVTGWRLGYAAGPGWLIGQMIKLQQFTFVCPPAPLQAGAAAAFGVDMRETVAAYERRRDLIERRLGGLCELPRAGGAFYAFPRLPDGLGPGSAFFERCLAEKLLVIPGGVFSHEDDAVRLSFAARDDTLARGLDVLERLLAGP